jgi:hypothetical protein
VRTEAWWIVVAALAAACHGPALPQVPGKGGPTWLELQSAHFTLWTDTSRERAQHLIREMEHHRQVVLGVGFNSARAEGRSFVLALRDAEEVGVFLPEQFVAMAVIGSAVLEPVIILPAKSDEDRAHVVAHELTHVISFHVIRNQPEWFSEGLANFFATVNLDPDRASGNLGEPEADIVASLKQSPPMPSAQLFACKDNTCKQDMFYPTAWALFTFLANTYPADLLRYTERLDTLPEGADAQAWAEVFPALTHDKLDHELRKWLAYGKHTVWKFNVKLQEWPVTERKLGDADVYAARALMRQIVAPEGAAPPPELAEALAADPTHLVAQLVSNRYKQPLAVEAARKIADVHAGDWRAWWLVAKVADFTGSDAHMAWQKACALLAKNPSSVLPADWCTPR